MRISDWSSDVCSSDLGQADVAGHHRAVFDGFTDELAKGVVDLALERAELAATGLHQFMLFGENNATPERSHVDFSIVDQERTQPVHPAPRMGTCFIHRSEEHTSQLQSLMRSSSAV